MQVPMRVTMSPLDSSFVGSDQIGHKVLLASNPRIVNKAVNRLDTDTFAGVFTSKLTDNLLG